MRNVHFTVGVIIAFGANVAVGQTQVDLRTQSKAVDFSVAAATSPMKTGTTFPATCTLGQMFFLSNGPAGSNLYACTAANTWTLEGGGGGGGGTGGSTTSLPDFSVAATGSTVLTIGGTCTNSSLCNARFGNTDYSFSQSALATITSGSGTAFIYLLSDGSLNVGSNVSVTCLRCTAVPGVTAFPPDSIPIATWAASGGTWVGPSGVDVRAFQSTTAVIPQTGLLASNVPGETILSIDTTVVGLKTALPGSSSSACSPGEWSTDGSFYYLCVSINSWRRAALSSF